MGSFIGYFKCDPFEFNFRLLAFSGYWPIETKNRWLLTLHALYCFLCSFSIISMLFIQILDIYLLRNDPINLVQNLSASSVTFGSIVKYILVFVKIEEALILHQQLEEFKKSRRDPEELEIFKTAEKQIIWATKSFYGLAIPCIVTWMLYPGLESSKKKRIPFPYRLPIDLDKTPVYEIIYTYQSMSMVGYMIVILSSDLIFYGYVQRISAEYDLMIKKINDLNIEYVKNSNKFAVKMREMIERYDTVLMEKVKKTFKEIFKLHQKVLGEVKQLKCIYSKFFLVHLLVSVTLIGTILIDLVAISKGVRLQMLQRIAYTICGLFDTYLLCNYGTKLQNKSVKLFRAMYSTPWYTFSPELRKDFMIISMQANRDPVIKAGNLFPINLSTFLSFLKTCYNLTNLLYQTMK